MDTSVKVLLIILVVIVLLYAVVMAARAVGDDEDLQSNDDSLQAGSDSGEVVPASQQDIIGLAAVIVSCTGLGAGLFCGHKVLQTLWS